MYDNVSQKIKRFTKVFTTILLILLPACGIFIGVRMFLAQVPVVYALAVLLASVILDFLIYYSSCFAYAVAERLEQQTIATGLLRQLVHNDRNAAAQEQSVDKQRAPYTPLQPTAIAGESVGQAKYTPPKPAAYPYAKAPYYPYSAPQTPPQYQPPYAPQYRTQTPYGTATGFNEEFRYEPKT